MRANPYNWIKQSREHREFGRREYPLIAGLSARSNGYPAFALQVQELPPRLQNQYVQEWKRWKQDYGETWDRLGCIKEQSLGQYTNKYRWTNWKPGMGRLGGLAGIFGAIGAGSFGSYDTTVGRPPPPMGQSIYPYPSVTFTWVGPTITVPGHPGWLSRPANVPGYEAVSYIYWRHDPYDLYMTGKKVAKPKAKPPSEPKPSPAYEPEEPEIAPAPEVVKAGMSPLMLLGLGALAVAGGIAYLRRRKRGKRKKGK